MPIIFLGVYFRIYLDVRVILLQKNLQDDPSYFTFFFDTSRRLSCYLAPERFCTSHELNLHPNLPGEFMDVSKGLTHAMDIFSLGCVLVELFTEGQCPFTYELLVKYK